MHSMIEALYVFVSYILLFSRGPRRPLFYQSIVYTNENVFVLYSPASLYIFNTLLMVLLRIPRLYSKLALAQSWTRRLF